ncbi:MAG: TetR/AcrR family transcriptional regulator [Candidatus Ratteibacteria bacterium]
MEVEKYSLREKKHAKTKIAIMNAFIKRLERTRFGDISIREICKNIEISEGTFFNYFSEKIDIINYYSYLIFLKIFWKTQNEVPQGKYLISIETVFKNAAAELNNINITYQMISIILMQREKPKAVTISNIEKHLIFPDYVGIENTPVIFIDDFFGVCLKAALKNGELPKKTNIDDVLVSLMTILAGTLLATKFKNIKDREYHYMRQLNLLWKGLGIKRR